MKMGRIDQVITKDTTEVWDVINTNKQPHSFHVHGVQFLVLSVAGAPPPADTMPGMDHGADGDGSSD